MCIYCYDLVIINSSFSTETECSDLLFPYLNGVADQGVWRGAGGVTATILQSKICQMLELLDKLSR